LSTIIKYFTLFSNRLRFEYIFLIFLNIISTILEAISFALIIPLVSIILDNGKINYIYFGKEIYFLKNYSLSNEKYLLPAIIIFFLFFLIKNIFLFLILKKQINFSFKLQELVANKILQNYTYQNYSFFISRKKSDLINLVTSQVDYLSGYISLPILYLLSEFLVIIGFVAIIIYFNLIKILFIFFGFLFFGIIILKILNNLSKINGIKSTESHNKITSITFSLLEAIKDLIILGRSEFFYSNYKIFNNKYLQAKSRLFYLMYLPKIILEILSIAALTLLIIFFIHYKSDSKEIVILISFFLAVAYRLIPSFNKIIISFQNIKFASSTFDLIYKDFFLKNEIVTIKDKAIFKDSFVLKDIFFNFQDKNKNVLNGLNLQIKKGEIIGIKGKTGVGKSTLVDIISCIIKPIKGHIYIDNHTISDPINIRKWQNNLGYVNQNVFLINDTIKNNIALGIADEKIDNNILKLAIKAAELDQFINSLELGINTSVGDRGVQLSGGQRQRIGIARALYNNSEFIIFDESTNALDANTERSILNTIRDLKNNNKTILIISHDQNSLKVCDIVYELKDGILIKDQE
jgi:ABC-type multidrug transport system fused ATPase/permease subunit